MPRIADDRVGYYPDILLDFSKDRVRERQQRYIMRWNLARHPMVYYISNTVPVEYRQVIREALLTWNKAFARIGYPNAVQVLDQPNDPAWDPDDMRYTVVHWLTQSNSGGYAQAGMVFDPRTGEILKMSIVVDADLMYFGNLEGEDIVGPVAQGRGFAQHEAAYAAEAHRSAMFGLWALRAQLGQSWRYIPPSYAANFLKSIVLHESGHGWGLQHNFIASEAYSPKELQNRAFTSRYGLANTVMEYTPTNVWPKGTPKGDYFTRARTVRLLRHPLGIREDPRRAHPARRSSDLESLGLGLDESLVSVRERRGRAVVQRPRGRPACQPVRPLERQPRMVLRADDRCGSSC